MENLLRVKSWLSGKGIAHVALKKAAWSSREKDNKWFYRMEVDTYLWLRPRV
jgi:hypothetical protein